MGDKLQARKKRKIWHRGIILTCFSAGLLCLAGTSIGIIEVSNGQQTQRVMAVENGEDGLESIQLTAYSEQEDKNSERSHEVEIIAKTVYGEAMVTGSEKEMAAVVWCILNRVDNPEYPNSIIEVITQQGQFHGYHKDHPVDTKIEALVQDVLQRWEAEKSGETNVGRVLPAEYLFFWGDGIHNHFTTEFKGKEEWDWTLQSPYDT